ncbi:MAG: hypothetical protein Fur0021_27020 [Candidatus Promineifilaceae bacterium]
MTDLPPSANTRPEPDNARAASPSSNWRRFWQAWLALALVAAAYLRFTYLQYSEIGPDQSILYLIAMRFVNGGPLPLAANKSSAGIMNPPLIEYLLALPLLLRTTVISPILSHAALSWSSVALLAWGSQRLFGWRVAALATLLFAVNPWAVHYSRFIWNPNPIPFFAAALLLALLAMLRQEKGTRNRRSAWWLALALPCLAAITQLHLSSLALLPAVCLILLLTWRRWRGGGWRVWLSPLLVGTALAFLLYLPFLLFERAVGFGDLQAIFNALVGGRSAITGTVPPAETNTASLALALELVSGATVWGTQTAWSAALPPGFTLTTLAQWLFGVSLLWAAVSILYRQWLRQPLTWLQWAQLMLLLWTLLPLLLYLRHTVYLQNYYFLYLFPAPFLLIALCLEEIGHMARREKMPAWLRQTIPAAAIILTLLLATWQFLIYYTGLRLLQAEQIGPAHTAGDTAAAIHVAADLLAQYPSCDLIILAAGGSAESSPLGLIEAFVHPRQARLLETGRGFILPANCALYLAAGHDPLAQTWLDAQAQPITPTATALNPDWRFYYVATAPADATPPLAVWQNGLELLHAELVGAPAPGNQLALNLTWRVTQTPPPDTRYHFFNHFLDASGALRAQDDAPAVQTQYWRRGDQLVTQFHLALPSDLPAGLYEIRTGIYTWPDLAQTPLTSGGVAYTITRLTVEANK